MWRRCWKSHDVAKMVREFLAQVWPWYPRSTCKKLLSLLFTAENGVLALALDRFAARQKPCWCFQNNLSCFLFVVPAFRRIFVKSRISVKLRINIVCFALRVTTHVTHCVTPPSTSETFILRAVYIWMSRSGHVTGSVHICLKHRIVHSYRMRCVVSLETACVLLPSPRSVTAVTKANWTQRLDLVIIGLCRHNRPVSWPAFVR